MGLPIFQSAGLGELPIYTAEWDGHAYFYAPGYAARTRADLASKLMDEMRTGQAGRIGLDLLKAAELAVKVYRARMHEAFAPVCLTLYLNDTCNLRCRYCFVEPGKNHRREISRDAITSAMRLVAENCQQRGLPLTVVVHGGGEPTRSFDLMRFSVETARALAGEKSLRLFRYLATNGVCSAKQAGWIARNFDLIGLSCDGPEDIQRHNRPLANGASSTPYIERSAGIFRAAGADYQVRVTLSPEDLRRQPDIAAYICERLRPAVIHVEPVFQGGRAKAGPVLDEEQANLFVDSFLAAREIAREFNCRWFLAGSRPNEAHASYCHPFRQVLNLVPGDAATMCFKTADVETVERLGLSAGKYDQVSGQFRIDEDRVRAFAAGYHKPARCQGCWLEYQCTYGCPEACTALGEDRATLQCAAARQLSVQAILASFERMPDGKPDEICGGELRLHEW